MALKWRGKNEFSLGSPESYTLSVANNGDDTLEAQDVVLEEDTYRRQIIAHLPKIAPGSTASVDFTTEIKPRMTIRDLPYSVSFRLKTTNYRQRFINCGLGCYNRGLAQFKPKSGSGPSVYNLLVFGTAGASKSSFLNTLMTMLRPDDGKDNKLERIAEVGGGADHTTRALHRYRLSDQFDVYFNIWDTWGLARDAYQDSKLVEILVDGKLPQNWDMSQSLDTHRAEFEKMKHEKLKTQMHGIIFFIPQMFVTDMDDDEQQRVKEVFQILIKKCYNPMVVVTKVDEIFRELRQNPFKNSAMVDDLRRKVADIFDIPSNNVRYSVNYLEEAQRSFEIECLVYETIQQALENCRSFEEARIMQYGAMSTKGKVDEDGLVWPD